MLLRIFNTCERFSHYNRRRFQYQLKYFCQDSNKIQETDDKKDIKKSKFPGYVEIYRLPAVTVVSAINRLKYRMAFTYAVCVPILTIVYKLNIMPLNIFTILLAQNSLLILVVFGIGFFSNDVIGIIYSDNDTKLKISYVSQWGKRVDIDTTVSDIVPIFETPKLRVELPYERLFLSSRTGPLKFYLKYDAIMDKEKVKSLFGYDKAI